MAVITDVITTPSRTMPGSAKVAAQPFLSKATVVF